MSQRSARRLAWSLCALYIVIAAAVVVLISLNHPSREWAQVAFVLAWCPYATVGALVASLRPRNPIGWMLCAAAVVAPLGEFGLDYGVYSLETAPGSLPGGRIMAWLGGWLDGSAWFVPVAVLPLLFPGGRLPSQRWRFAAWLFAAFWITFSAVALLAPGPLIRQPNADNPVGIEPARLLFEVLEVIAFFSPALVVVSAAAVMSRYRRSSGLERQQLKWFVYAYLVSIVAAAATIPVGGELPFAVAIAGAPFGVGIAILRHRLYDIDVVIRRTLVYGALTAILAGAYFGLVLLLQLAFQPLTRGSDLAIAGSTLAVAALFRPARRRIQAAVDHRFYRRRYDAQRTLEGFSARLREQVDLEALSGELRSVVRETVQPAHVSIWLRRPAAASGTSVSEWRSSRGS